MMPNVFANVIACLVEKFNWRDFVGGEHTERFFDLNIEKDIGFVVRYVPIINDKRCEVLIFHERRCFAYPMLAFDVEAVKDATATAKLIHHNAYTITNKKRLQI